MRYPLLLCFMIVSLFKTSHALEETEQTIINELKHPVLKFQKLGIEPILSYKDDQGFAPLKINENSVKSKYWNMEFDTYHYQLQNLFAYELKGHKTHVGIHFPNITRFYQTIIEFNHENISVRLADDSFNTLSVFEPIDLKKQGWSINEGLEFCRDFLNKYVLFDHLYINFHKKKRTPQEMEVNSSYWTLIDDYIYKLTINLKNIPDQKDSDDTPNNEVIRQIGEFFKWRNILIDYIRGLSFDALKEISLNRMFKQKLIDENHLSPSLATQYSNLMTVKNAQIIMMMSTVNPDNLDHLNCIFDHFVKKGLIKAQDKQKYMDFFA